MCLVIESNSGPLKTQVTVSHKHIEKSTNTKHNNKKHTQTHTYKHADWQDMQDRETNNTTFDTGGENM